MSKIVSIATAVPPHAYPQEEILGFMQNAYGIDDTEMRKLRFLYKHSGIDTRYSVIDDYSLPAAERTFFPASDDLEPFPGIERRMELFAEHAPGLSQESAEACLEKAGVSREEVTHLITVSCTGLSAPGLELELMERMGLRLNIHRTAVNFMGCYAAVHGLKMADAIAKAEPGAKVLVVCTELCSLHFQKAYSMDSAAASLLFADGSAAALVVSDAAPGAGLQLDGFYAEVLPAGKKDMAWALSSTGFVMTLTGYVPDLVGRDLGPLKERALQEAGIKHENIRYWAIHPGGKRILHTVEKGLDLSSEDLACSYKVLREKGNMSSVTILAVLAEMWEDMALNKGEHLFGAAFGPGLTMESFIGTAV